MSANNPPKKPATTRREVEAMAFIILGIIVTNFFLFLTAESANLFLLTMLSLIDAVLLGAFLMTLYFYLKPDKQAEQPSESKKKKEVPPSNDHRSMCLGILLITLGLSLVVMLGVLAEGKVIDLPFAVIFAIVATVVTLTISAVVFNELKLSNQNEALGLPKGTIRAIIALSLIVLFAIIIIFVETQLAPKWIEFPFNATVAYPNGTIVNYGNGTAILTEPNQAQKDFSLQMLTTISTLVVAIVGFYFGTRAVQVAQGETPTSSIDITPESPTELNISLNKAVDPIKVNTTPENESVIFKVANPKDGTISRKEKLNEFRFEASKELIDQAKTKPEQEKEVTLLFWLANNPQNLAPLEVKIISGTQTGQTSGAEAPGTLRITDPGSSVEISPGEEKRVVLEATEAADKDKNIVFDDDYDKALIESITSDQKGTFTVKVKANAKADGKTTVTFRLEGTDSTTLLEITVKKANS
jgi:multidrug efflux pump subunit AcrA (membrane-fusion protein)